MGNAAAFFDLDRTILRGASGPIIGEALATAGVGPSRGLPGQSLIYRVYDVIGESLPGIALSRAAALTMKGRSPASLRAAAAQAADRLEDLVAPYAPALLDEHRRAGRALVLATTTPFDLIEPLAQRLEFDDVIATRYATSCGADGVARYTGGLDGGFVWGMGKLAAVKRWAADHDVDLSESWAYSDSIYDLPLLSAVGHPQAVNADPRLAALATVRRWPQLHLDVPPGVPKVLGLEPYDLVKAFNRPELFPYARFDIAGTEHIPATGPAIVVANHRSYFDAAAVGLTIMRAGRSPRALAKKEIFDAPVLGQLAKIFGQIKVDRGSSGGNALDQAILALRGGEVVVLMPQGTIPRGRAFFDPQLVGKSGAARLAAATGVPVIPIGVWGTEKVWPRSSRLPNVTNVLHPPQVRVRVGPPVAGLEGLSPRAATKRIMDAIVALLPPEAREAREPTEAEIAAASPPGSKRPLSTP
jgi:putative phosphoserine phosphatase / 1-acylglycerol-3-phosphate O-acyltransferase